MFDRFGLWASLYGNDALKERLAADIAGKRLAHAYIFEGAENSGKLTLARIVAAAMSGNERDVKKILSAASPDVIEIDLPEKRKTIGVDTVREMKLTSYIRPNDLDFKAFIVNHAEALTTAAQNALLKLVEEPPAGVYILLLAENMASLLPTIRSRAPVLRMQSFSVEELTELLLAHSAEASRLYERDREAFLSFVRSAGGAYGEALLSIEKAGEKRKDSAEAVIGLLEAVSLRDRTALVRGIWSLAPDREALGQTLLLLRLAVRDVIAYRATGGDCDYLFPKNDRISELADRLSIDRLLGISDVLAVLEKDFIYNPNLQSAKALLYTRLSEV